MDFRSSHPGDMSFQILFLIHPNYSVFIDICVATMATFGRERSRQLGGDHLKNVS